MQFMKYSGYGRIDASLGKLEAGKTITYLVNVGGNAF